MEIWKPKLTEVIDQRTGYFKSLYFSEGSYRYHFL